MECIYKGGPDQTEYLGGRCIDGEVKGGIGIPGLDSFLVGLQHEHRRHRPQPDPRRTTSRPRRRCCTSSFDIMVGIGTALLPARAPGSRSPGGGGGTCPTTPGSCGSAAVAGVAAVVALECGWIVTEVGRQPWIVNGYMRTSEAVTPAQGIWWVFALTMALYVALGRDRRARASRPLAPLARGRGADEGELPYGRRRAPASGASA